MKDLFEQNNVELNDPNHPYGKIVDTSGVVDGTVVGENVIADFIEVFDKIFDFVGLTHNDNPDNKTNKYQTAEVLADMIGRISTVGFTKNADTTDAKITTDQYKKIPVPFGNRETQYTKVDNDFVPQVTGDVNIDALENKSFYFARTDADYVEGDTWHGKTIITPHGFKGGTFIKVKIRDDDSVEIQNYESSPLPDGLIMPFFGALINIPNGWNLCDGTNGTRDLTDRFIMGRSGQNNVGVTGGETEVTLVEEDLPGHTHGVIGNGGHSHSTKKTNTNSHNHILKTSTSTGVAAGGNQKGISNYSSNYNEKDRNTNHAGDHDHSGSISNNTHTHTSQDTGGGVAHNNIPPYYSIYFIQKI